MRAVVGLGNPGPSYRRSRHNAGFMLVDGIVEGNYLQKTEILCGNSFFSRLSGNKFKKNKGHFLSCEAELENIPFLLVKPDTYMNESGRAVEHLLKYGKVKDLSEILVVVDDVDLELGRVRFRSMGSDGGHNGLRSIIRHVGSREFARLRIGVGPRPEGEELVDYVLGSFSQKEYEVLERSLLKGSETVGEWLKGGSEGALKAVARTQ